ncbi:DNA mismatch repair endonuclease MutL [Pannus brasiliensis CCIBt3594]|uniref:DNA mismatch repair protein MutL n=1 Tax=Pannus brasiliensis CCIBt3594 TaxID=1427578 RepID=A0AAW9QP05_9CHRO
MPIQVLPKDVIDLIAAGEVIDSLAAVVRELVENAIDAGADRITVSLSPELWRIRVTDNGRGMSVADLELCSRPHSTSKISRREDLWKITSLGFRGEALHSIARVARLSIASRNSEEMGWRGTYNTNGELESLETIAIATGTIVTVEHIFRDFPVRRKGLPPKSRQIKDIQSLIHDIALCHPHITWQTVLDGKDWFKISPGSGCQHILPQIIKSLHLSDLAYLQTEIEAPDHNLSTLELAIGLPDRVSRRLPDRVKVAVNGRVVRCPDLESSLCQGFARTLPKDRYPVGFLHLHTDPSAIDWNRHPAKAEIYLHSLPFWQEQAIGSIERAFRLHSEQIPEKAHNQRVTRVLKAAEEKTPYQIPDRPRDNLLNLKAVAQVNNTYIVAEHPNGLWLVEQHIAHERVLFERLEDQWKIVPLESPVIVDRLAAEQIEQLQRIGIDIDEFGERSWAIRSIPALLAERDDRSDALLELSWGGDLQTARVAVACRSAIRNGTPLSIEKMQELLEDWQNTRNPRTCPHGRPIYLSLEETSLARFFRRHWVIGKSHGI